MSETFSYGSQDLRTLPPALGRQHRLLGRANARFREFRRVVTFLSPTNMIINIAALIRHAWRSASWARRMPRVMLTSEYIGSTMRIGEYSSSTMLPGATLTGEDSSPAMLLENNRKRSIHVMHDEVTMRLFDPEIDEIDEIDENDEPPRKKIKLEPMDHPVGSNGRSAGGLAGGRWISRVSLTMEKRSLPYRCPPFPTGGGKKAIRNWNNECRRISRLAANDPNTYPPILAKLKGVNSANAVSDLKEKNLVLRAADFIVSVSSIGNDGVEMEYTGIIINVCDSSGRAKILTCSLTMCDEEGRLFDRKPLVHLANRTAHEAKVILIDDLYKIAVLEISNDKPLRSASLSPSLLRGSTVFALARDNGNLKVSTGKVLWADEPWLACNCYMYLSCNIPQHGTGGPVIDEDGKVTGMAFDLGTSNGAVLPSSVLMKCIEMQSKFGRIAHPMHGLSLRTVEHLDLSLRDEISREHNISDGYLVLEVPSNSNAEILGIRDGDIILSFDGLHSHTLVQLEDHLLSIGSEFLEKRMSSDSMVVLELQVYAPLEKRLRDIRLPVGFPHNRSLYIPQD